jgi:hypothetical protein
MGTGLTAVTYMVICGAISWYFTATIGYPLMIDPNWFTSS